jgi:hypothetical protein
VNHSQVSSTFDAPPAEHQGNSSVLRGEALQKTGKRWVVAGFAITILGVVSYCLACFAGGVDAEMGDIMLRNAVPFARVTLAILGLGCFVWLIGSLTYLRGAMEIDDDGDDDRES